MKKSKTVEIKGSATPRRLVIKTKCGNCDHLNRSPYYGDVCSKLGIKEFSKPCQHFKVSPLSVDFQKGSMAGIHLSRLMRNVRTNDLTALAAIINTEHITRKHGFHMGQPVYLRIFSPGSHLNHYAAAHVVSADAKKVYVQGVSGFRAEIYHRSVITSEEFAIMRRKMIKEGKTVCPKASKYFGLEEREEKSSIRNIESIRMVQPEHGAVEGELALHDRQSKGPKVKTVLLSGDSNQKRPAPKQKPKTLPKAKSA